MDFKNIKDSVSDVFQKSAEMFSSFKDKCSIKMEIAHVEAEIDSAYRKLGKLSCGGAAAEGIKETPKELKAYIKSQYVILDALKNKLDDVGSTTDEDQSEDSSIAFCANCGRTGGADDDFCSKCGTPLKKL